MVPSVGSTSSYRQVAPRLTAADRTPNPLPLEGDGLGGLVAHGRRMKRGHLDAMATTGGWHQSDGSWLLPFFLTGGDLRTNASIKQCTLARRRQAFYQAADTLGVAAEG